MYGCERGKIDKPDGIIQLVIYLSKTPTQQGAYFKVNIR